MIGPGTNKKSMAYIENIIAFLDVCISTRKKYALINYIDEPNLSMKELVEMLIIFFMAKKL